MISAIALEHYGLPFRSPWRSAGGSLGERAGWLVRCEASGEVGFGDCAPLPAAGTENEGDAWAWLNDWRHRSMGRDAGEVLADLEAEDAPAPAARFAAECALSDLLARIEAVPLAIWLEPGAGLTVPVNAALGAIDAVEPLDIATAAAAGYCVFKIKVGVGGLDPELERLHTLAGSLPEGGRLRLDANRAWTRTEAGRAISALAALPVESLEEPLRGSHPGHLRELQARAAFPLALDESLGSLPLPLDPKLVPVRRLVLKPAVLGGLRRTLGLAQAAIAAGTEVVVTSLVESAAGVWPTAQLAAAIGSPLPQGLATSGWLARDLGEGPLPTDGQIRLPPVPGSGFRPA